MRSPFIQLDSRFILAAAMLLTTGIVAGGASSDDIVRVGAGSYRTTAPTLCKPLPQTIYRTANYTGPVLTHQWWSSLLWQKYSQPLFAHPLAGQCVEQGFNIAYIGGHIHGGPGGIFGEGIGKSGDLRLGHSAAASFPQADCDGCSDWFATAAFNSGAASMRVTIGHGSPFVYCLYAGGNPTVTFARTPRVFSGDANSPVLGVTCGDHHYALFGAAGSTWTGLQTPAFTNNANGKPYFSIALLPDDKPQTLALFARYAYNHVIDTQVTYKMDAGKLQATYRFITKPYEGAETGTLFALYPHQWKHTATQLTDFRYGSVRGVMKVGKGSEFTTEIPMQGVLPFFPTSGIPDRGRLLAYLREQAEKKPARFADTYYEGKHLGALASLSGIADAAGDHALKRAFIDEMKRRLEEWFTAAPGKEQPVFYYNPTWGTLIGSRPSFGSDKPLNDHHFHYGYFIRAAAEIARVDPAWSKKWGPMVNLLIRDIASPDRQDKMFPFFRCFDKYAGHSWASGDANFGDGNNQESSSESMNAWYALTLWGCATDDAAARDAGLFLFNTERTAIEEYWFDVSGTNFPADFPNAALGMIWGGKGAFATWFSADVDCIHGINWLPFTPASIYLGRSPEYVKRNHDRVVARRKAGNDFNKGWGDLVVMFGALQDPAPAAAYIDANPACKLEAGNTHAFMYHWIHTLDAIGINDASVTADYPIYNVFNKAGLKTYAVYNYQPAPITVHFSDRHALTAKPGTLTVDAARP